MIVSSVATKLAPLVVGNTAKPPRVFVSTDSSGKLLRQPLLSAYSDEWSIIATLQQLVEDYGRNPQLRAFSISLLTSVKNNDVRRNAVTLTEWVKEHVIYMADPDGAELLQSPFYMLAEIQKRGNVMGDCDDHVLLLGSMLVSIGIPVKVSGVRINNGSWFNHVIVTAKIFNDWIDIDPCIKDGMQPIYSERLVG
jgi:hypothetical protein